MFHKTQNHRSTEKAPSCRKKPLATTGAEDAGDVGRVDASAGGLTVLTAAATTGATTGATAGVLTGVVTGVVTGANAT